MTVKKEVLKQQLYLQFSAYTPPPVGFSPTQACMAQRPKPSLSSFIYENLPQLFIGTKIYAK